MEKAGGWKRWSKREGGSKKGGKGEKEEEEEELREVQGHTCVCLADPRELSNLSPSQLGCAQRVLWWKVSWKGKLRNPEQGTWQSGRIGAVM